MRIQPDQNLFGHAEVNLEPLTSARPHHVVLADDAYGYLGEQLRLRISWPSQSDFPRLAGGTIPFIRKYSTICP
jgi:hypothetical protein